MQFPDDESLIRTRPVFTFRDPYRVFDIWLTRGWDDIESFFVSYETLLQSYEYAKSLNSETVFYTYDYIAGEMQQQIDVFQTICKYWGLEFREAMLEFKSEFGDNFVYATDPEKTIYTEKNPKGIFTKH